MRDMNILVATNDGFVFPTMVMIKSIEKTKSSDIFLNIYILHSELLTESKGMLDSLNRDDIKIYYLRVDDELFVNVPIYEYFSKEVYFRLIAHTLLPENLDRILWIDGDIIVKRQLNSFYYQDFGEEILIACEDMLNGHNEELHNKFGIPNEKTYFSSGVMLYNLPNMREKVCVEEVFKFIDNNRKKIEIVDQDVLNAMFFDDVKVLDNNFDYNYFAGFLKPRDYKKKMDQISILHYCGGWKPWKNNYPYYGFEEFWKVGNEIPGGLAIYNEIRNSYIITHQKWVIYETLKSIIGKIIPLNVLKKILRK